MARGRPPKPIERHRATARDATHKADGRALVAPGAGAQAAVRAVIPIPADELGGRGLSEWEKIWTAGYWLKDDQDYAWVLMISHAYDDIEAFRAQVKLEGLIQTGSMGQVIAHPLIAEIRRAEAVVMKALSTLGFSPTDRARLGLAEAKAQSALKDLIDRTPK